MSLVANAIDALFNGVSQQPANMRLPSQCEEQVNAYATVADGLKKRAPSQFIAKLTATGFVDPFIHIINRDTTNRHAMVVTDGAFAVYDLSDGSSGTILYEAASTYLDLPVGEKASDSFEVVTVADYSFVVNKTVVIGTIGMPTASPVQFGRWYFPKNWTRAADGSRYFTPSFGTEKGSKQTIQDLPNDEDAIPPANGDFYTIEGNSDSGFSKFYVIRQGGVWVETHAFMGSVALDETTMPHAIINEAGTFTLREFGWIPRLFGDGTTNPVPSFVGKNITSLGYHKNRLVVSAGENIIFSGAGDYGNFFRNTVTQLLDSDVVDVAVSTKSVSNINHILPAENGMMFFSDQAQFSLNVDQLLTPGTVSIDVATSYEMSQKLKPINIGQDVYFGTETGNFSRIREYTMGDGEALATDATDITAHVSRYLPKNLFALTGSSNEDVLFALSNEPGFENRVYVYKFFFSGGDKVQSAWGYWKFADDDVIKNIEILNNNLYMIVERSDGTFLEKVDVQQTAFPLNLTFDVFLDKRFEATAKSYDLTDTTITLPYDIDVAERDDFRLVQASGLTPGRVLDNTTFVWTGLNTVKVPGDWTATDLLGGLNYVMEYTFSEQFNRSRDGTSITVGRYQLRTFTVVYEDYATFNTSVDPYGNGAGLTEDIVTAGMSDFTAKTIGASTAILGQPTFEDGIYSFQIYGNSKDAVVKLTNDQPFGGSFVSATVEGFFTNRGR